MKIDKIDENDINAKLLEISTRVKMLRMQRNIKQTELANALGISQTNLSNIERGRTGLSLANLLKIQQYLGCPIYAFFPDEVQDQNSPSLIKALMTISEFIQNGSKNNT